MGRPEQVAAKIDRKANQHDWERKQHNERRSERKFNDWERKRHNERRSERKFNDWERKQHNERRIERKFNDCR